VFASNGTDALNTAISGLVPDGAHVVTTGLEHNAVARVLNHSVKERSLRVTVVGANPAGYVEAGAVAEALQEDTCALIINHASNVIGSVQALDDIAALAQQAGVPVILDAAQTVGVVPIDMDRRGLAVVAFPGHKGLFGPMGSAALVVAEGIELQARRFGGTGVADVNEALDDADRLDAASHGKACERAIHHVHAVELGHIRLIEKMLSSASGVQILGDAQEPARVATLSLVHESMDPQQMADRLDADHQVCCRAGLQCAPWARAVYPALHCGLE